MKIYVDNRLVATHKREHEYGYTHVPEHLASKSRAITERSAAYYIQWAGKQSEDCKAYVTEIFNPRRTNNPEEVYYRICGAIISSYRKYESPSALRTACFPTRSLRPSSRTTTFTRPTTSRACSHPYPQTTQTCAATGISNNKHYSPSNRIK